MSDLEMRVERGTLRAYCVKCNSALEKTTVELQELAHTGEFKSVDVVCDKCSAAFQVNLQLGVKEHGA